ncbi:MAG: NAD-dependent epimerase/dehydratase family protein [Betaproteobacteria bacterium]
MAQLRVLLIGCGDVALRAARLLSPDFRIYGLTRRGDQHAALRAAGITPIAGDLDRRATLDRLRVSPYAVLHCAPPPGAGEDDSRTRNLLAALTSARSLPRAFVYVSTSGIYGDCAGARIDETRAPGAESPRARRRVAAESRLRAWSRRSRVRLSILRAPGIYALDRLPIDRLREGTPVLRADDDVYTNHIHAEDLARACVAAMFRGLPLRAYNISDDAELKMGEYFDQVATALALPRPPRIAREAAARVLPPVQMSFMRESRRLLNARAKRDLRWRLLYPTPAALLATIAAPAPLAEASR